MFSNIGNGVSCPGKHFRHASTVLQVTLFGHFFESSPHFYPQKKRRIAHVFICFSVKKSPFSPFCCHPATHLPPPNFPYKQGLSGGLVAGWQQIFKKILHAKNKYM
jgi:hypothetical protein